MTCNNCTWFVTETATGEWTHEKAVEKKSGFCLVKDLFTHVKPRDPSCNDFNNDGVKKNGK